MEKQTVDFTKLPLDGLNNTLSDAMSSYTLQEANDRLVSLNDLFLQHLGKKWKLIIFLCILFIFGLIWLVMFRLEFYTKHINVFIMVFILSIVFLITWMLILPEKYTKIAGVVPYPKDYPYIPVDTTNCGLTPVQCTSDSDCCADKNGASNYTCTTINKDNVYYLGANLDNGKQFCLPKKGIEKINNCGTYTGRFVWAKQEDDTQSWVCKCLYPDLYSGDKCTDKEYNGTFKKIINGNSYTWDITNMPVELASSTPYDNDMKMSCDIGYNFYGGDCRADKCFNGTKLEEGQVQPDNAKFDTNKMMCICGDRMTQSNINGYCYTIDASCKADPTTKKCQYDMNLMIDKDKSTATSALFKIDSIPYLTFKNNASHVLVNVGTCTGVPSELVEMRGTSLLNDTTGVDAFYPYKRINPADISADDQQTVQQIITGNKYIKSVTDLTNLFSNSSKNIQFGVARPCNSFFYFQGNNYPKCNNMFSKTGTDYVQFCSNDSKTDCSIDVDGYYCTFDLMNGKNCNCSGDENTSTNGKCKKCTVYPNDISTYDTSLCCSGWVKKNQDPFNPEDPYAPVTYTYECGELKVGVGCKNNGQCEHGCGRNGNSTSDLQCCGVGTNMIDARDYCVGQNLPSGSECRGDAQCASHTCDGNGNGIYNGNCQ